jgi:hypothetical protein
MALAHTTHGRRTKAAEAERKQARAMTAVIKHLGTGELTDADCRTLAEFLVNGFDVGGAT